MSTLKMTFSLASLILILGLVFVTAPAMAQSRTIDVDVAISTLTINNNAGTAVTSIPAGGYLILSKAPTPAGARTVADNNAGLPALPANAVHGVWAAMPDLEALFGEEGGTIVLKASQTNVDDAGAVATTGATRGLKPALGSFPDYRYDDDGDDDGLNADGTAQGTATAANGVKDDDEDGVGTDPATAGAATVRRDPSDGDLVITEIMWALNTANVGSGNEHNHQWIEIHNTNTKAALPVAGLVLYLESGRPATADAEDTLVGDATTALADLTPKRIVVDRVSNVVGAGWVINKGQNGFEDDSDTKTPFVSMYRQRDKFGKNDGTNNGHWHTSSQVSYANHKGTPGKKERAGATTFTATTIPRSPIIFNEIANRNANNKAYEWIELRNVTDGTVNLKNWQILYHG